MRLSKYQTNLIVKHIPHFSNYIMPNGTMHSKFSAMTATLAKLVKQIF